MLPQARKTNLIVESMRDELLVYDMKTHRAHSLNASAAAVFKLLQAEPASTSEVAATLGMTEEVVLLALRELRKARLLESDSVIPVQAARLSRRDLLKTMGKAAVVLPLVTSIMAPSPAHAASCVEPPNACTGFGQGTCCAGFNCVLSHCQ